MYKNILAPIDINSKSRVEIKAALNLADIFNSKLYILSVHEDFKSKDEMLMSRVSVASVSDEMKNLALEAKDQIDRIINSEDSSNVDYEILLRDGTPNEAIVKMADEFDINLIVMGTDGKDTMGDYLSGTISQKVIDKSPCPVLVIPKDSNHE